MSKTDSFDDKGVANHWNTNADQWTNDVRAGYDTYRELFTWPAFADFAGNVNGKRIVDLGCGEGTNTRRLARAGARMVGVDLSDKLIEHARQSEREEPLGISYVAGSYSAHIPLPEASFDGAISTLALMDGPDLLGAFQQAFRLLRPGGSLSFSVLHPCHITPGLRWERGPDRTTLGLIVDGYHSRQPFAETWSFGDRPTSGADADVQRFSIPRFPRTMADWCNTLVEAGFVIQRIEEPVPSEEAIAASPRLARWRDIGAFLLLVRANKPD